MKFAVVNKEGQVVNVIVGKVGQLAELEGIVGMELVDAQPFNLRIGDLRVGGKWTRNVRGEQVILTERPTYTDLEEMVAEQAEVLDILGGGDKIDRVRAVAMRESIANMISATSEVNSKAVSKTVTDAATLWNFDTSSTTVVKEVLKAE